VKGKQLIHKTAIYQRKAQPMPQQVLQLTESAQIHELTNTDENFGVGVLGRGQKIGIFLAAAAREA